MSYMNLKTGKDQCPEIMRKAVADGFRKDVKYLNHMQSNKDRFPLTPFMVNAIGRLSDTDIEQYLTEDNVKQLSRRLGVPAIRSSLWGASQLARHKVCEKLGKNAIERYEVSPGSYDWGFFATSVDAIVEYEKQLKFNIEWLIGRSL